MLAPAPAPYTQRPLHIGIVRIPCKVYHALRQTYLSQFLILLFPDADLASNSIALPPFGRDPRLVGNSRVVEDDLIAEGLVGRTERRVVDREE